jgi:hypothetical protein
MEGGRTVTEGLPAFLGRHPTAQYALLCALGVIGIFLAMPIGLSPASRLEWVDSIINFVILVPSLILTAVGGVLTVASTVAPSLRDPDTRSARFASTVLRSIGVPRALVPDIAVLGPIGLLAQIFFGEEEAPTLSGPDAESDER